MIKILRPGTKKEAECPSCGALLSYDITLHRFNYAFELCLLENLDTRQLPEYFEYVFFDKILEYFIECEKEAFSAEEFL